MKEIAYNYCGILFGMILNVLWMLGHQILISIW